MATQITHPDRSKAYCDVLGKLEVGYQSIADLVHIKFDAAEVWKGDRGMIASFVQVVA